MSMRTAPTRLLIAMCVLLLAATVRAALQGPQTPTVSKLAGTGSVTGRVVEATTGAPISGAIVELTVTPPPAASNTRTVDPAVRGTAPLRVLTDVNGQFAFKAVTAGSVEFAVTAHNYVGGGYNQLRSDGQPQALDVADDQHISDVTLKLWRTGAITGRVIDEAGDPVVGVLVRVLRRVIVGGQGTLQLSGAGRATDDRGVYRASGLLAGNYIVEVPVSRATTPAPASDSDPGRAAFGEQFGNLLVANGQGRRGDLPAVVTADSRMATYPTVFYPSTSLSSRATVISLRTGEERSGVDVQLTLVPAFKVGGVITDLDGSPAANLAVELLLSDDQNNLDGALDNVATTTTGARGEFTMLGVPPGTYQALVVRAAPSAARMGGGPPAAAQAGRAGWARASVAVTDHDVVDLAVSLRPTLVVSGRVAFVGASPQPSAQQRARGVQVDGVGPGVRTGGRAGGRGQMLASPIGADASFAISGTLPGKYMILPPSWSALKWIATSITVGGRDVSDVPVDIDADLPDVLITFSDKRGELAGAVSRGTGEADATALVVGFLVDSRTWGWPGIHQFSTRTTAAGTYATGPVAPGDYLVAAIPDEIAQSWQLPETLKRIAAAATQVTVGDSVRLAQNLVTVAIK